MASTPTLTNPTSTDSASGQRFSSPGRLGFHWPRIHPDENASLSQVWAPAIDELLRIRKLENDWDGEGGEAPPRALVDGAIVLARHFQDQAIPPPDRVHASVNATVYFEWHTPDGYREIEMLNPTEAECRWLPKGSTVAEVIVLTRQP